MSHLRVIYAVAKKDLEILFRYPTWFISLLIWPIVFPLMYIMSAVGLAGPQKSGLSTFYQNTGSKDYIGYILVGTIVWMAVNMVMWNFGSYLRNEQMRGTLESNWLCPVNKFDILVGGGIQSMVLAILNILVSMVEYRIVYGFTFKGGIISICAVFFSIIPGIYGFGLIFASLILWLKQINAAVNVARGLIMILCGVSFPIFVMPNWMQNLSKLFPFTYGIDAARQVMVNGAPINLVLKSLLISLAEGIGFIIIGRLLFIKIEKRVKESGSLERF